MYSSEGPPMTPFAFNSNLQIVQDAGHVAILQEMIHSARVIRPIAARTCRRRSGSGRGFAGHWEGDTLVVDTTNFTDRTSFHGSTENLHLTERFTRIDADSIIYEFTAEDPATWTRPGPRRSP